MEREEALDQPNEETINQLMKLRSYLDERVQKLEEEAEKLKTLTQILDDIIVLKSFRSAETIIQVPTEKLPTEREERIPLKTSYGILLANIYVDETKARITPVEELVFTTDTPPFQSFLVNRILKSMETSDREASQRGEIVPEDILSYEIVTDENNLKEITIKNYGSKKRLKEITSTSRWTLEKMYEKTHPTG